MHAASAILESGAYRCWSVEPKCKMGVHNYEGDGCYDALGTACHEAGEDSAGLRLIKSMDLPS